MKIVIVEDDRQDADILEKLIREYERKHMTEFQLAHYASGEAFLAAAAFETYHLVFMDIYMNKKTKGGQTDKMEGVHGADRMGGVNVTDGTDRTGGAGTMNRVNAMGGADAMIRVNTADRTNRADKIDGIEAARRLTALQPDCLTVFLTSSREDIWRAVEMHACFDYVEKSSLTFGRVERLLDDVRRKLHMQTKVLEFYSGKQKMRFSISKIQYLVSHDKYIIFTMADGGEQSCRVTFSSICPLLEKEKRFLLCNRGIMVNMDYIRRADRESFEMSNGIFLPIRKRSHLEIMKKYNDYQFEKLNEEL